MLMDRVFGVMFKAIDIIDELKRRIQPIIDGIIEKRGLGRRRSDVEIVDVSGASSAQKDEEIEAKKTTRKVSPKKASRNVTTLKRIDSPRAEKILANIKSKKFPLIKKGEKIGGKASLAGLVWALSHAEKSQVKDGISVHDISALLYKAAKIEMFPINISRMVHDNQSLIKQVSQEKRTKRYLLTPEGHHAFLDLSRHASKSGKKKIKTRVIS